MTISLFLFCFCVGLETHLTQENWICWLVMEILIPDPGNPSWQLVSICICKALKQDLQ